jgi:hypothetical protein
MLSSLSSLPCMRSASRVVGPRPVAHVRYCARNSGRERIACSIPDPVVGLWSGIYILQEQFRVPSADSLNATHAAYCQSPEQHASRGVLGIRQRMRSWVCRAGQGRSEQWWSLDAGYCIHIRRVLPFTVFSPFFSFCSIHPYHAQHALIEASFGTQEVCMKNIGF